MVCSFYSDSIRGKSLKPMNGNLNFFVCQNAMQLTVMG